MAGEQNKFNQLGAPNTGPSENQKKQQEIMEIWYQLTDHNRDHFMTHMKKYQEKSSEDGSAYSEKEYRDLLRLSKLDQIPEYIKHDAKGRPAVEVRNEKVKVACENYKFDSQPYRRCYKLYREIVGNQSEAADEISDAEWDKFQTLIKKLPKN